MKDNWRENMNLEMSDIDVIVNCSKTAIRIIEETDDLKKKLDFSKQEIESALNNLLEKNAQLKDYTILHSICSFCLEIGGLENLGLRYDYDTIQQVILNLEAL